MSGIVNSTTLRQRVFHLTFQLILFSVIYNSLNWHSARLQISETFILPLDNIIPFIPWMLIPYSCSIIFFIVAFATASKHTELMRLCQRVALATLLAGICFYLYPLNFSFYPHEIPFPWDKGYELLYLMDRPYNQLPSLHVIYAVIFMAHFHLRYQGRIRWLLNVALCTVIISTIFTYQHHLIDVITGFIVAGIILRLTRSKVYASVPFAYTSLAITTLLLGAVLDHILLSGYLSLCFLSIATAYKQSNAKFFGKNTEGKLAPLKQLICAPYLVAYWLMWRVQVHINKTPINTLSSWLSVGRRLSPKEIKTLGSDSIIIDLSAEMPRTNCDSDEQQTLHYYNYPILDLAPITMQQAVDVCQLIDSIRQAHPNKKIYLHCTMGLSRSFAIAACYLVWIKQIQANAVKPWLIKYHHNIKLSETYLSIDVLKTLQTQCSSAPILKLGNN